MTSPAESSREPTVRELGTQEEEVVGICWMGVGAMRDGQGWACDCWLLALGQWKAIEAFKQDSDLISFAVLLWSLSCEEWIEWYSQGVSSTVLTIFDGGLDWAR